MCDPDTLIPCAPFLQLPMMAGDNSAHVVTLVVLYLLSDAISTQRRRNLKGQGWTDAIDCFAL